MADECPVCFRELCAGDAPPPALECANGHQVCTECVRVLVRPGGRQRSRLRYRCPCCRANTGLTLYHMMVLVKGDWASARAAFDDEREVAEWLRGESATAPCV